MPPAASRRNAESGNFPVTPQSLAAHRIFPGNSDQLLSGRKYAPPVSSCAPQGQVYSARHPVDNIAVATVSRVPLLHHHPRTVHIPQITARLSQDRRQAVMVTSGRPRRPVFSATANGPVQYGLFPYPADLPRLSPAFAGSKSPASRA